MPCLFLLVPKWHYWGTCSATTSGSGTHRCQGFIQPGHFEPKNGGSGLDNDFPFTIWSSRFFPESVNLGDFDPFHRSLPTKNTPFCRWGDIKLKIFRFPLQTTGNHHFKCLKLHCVFWGGQHHYTSLKNTPISGADRKTRDDFNTPKIKNHKSNHSKPPIIQPPSFVSFDKNVGSLDLLWKRLTLIRCLKGFSRQLPKPGVAQVQAKTNKNQKLL